MKRILLVGLAGVVLGVALTLSVSGLRHLAAHHAEGTAEEAEAPAADEESGTVTLDPEAQQSVGIEVGHPRAAEAAREVAAFGHVLDPTPLATAMMDVESAGATLSAATKEYERQKTLYAMNQNVSARSVEAAEVAMRNAATLAETARSRLLIGWGKSLADRKDLHALVSALSSLSAALVRIDLFPGETPDADPVGAKIRGVTEGSRLSDAEVIGPTTSSDVQAQGRGFLLLSRSSDLKPGMAVEGRLLLPGAARTGLAVPRAAIVRHAGAAWIYVRTDEGTFERRAVTLGAALPDEWLVTGELTPEDDVVVSGAQHLLSEELNRTAPEEE